jgi:succinate dehydrogenase/fumarate reductase flavoprotein subunit/uncharacterized protein with FMN-binding domain
MVLTTSMILGSVMPVAAAQQEAGAMTPGEYTSTVASMKGDMTVHVTVDETSITDISVDTVDTVQIVGAVIENLIPEIIEKQSIKVDGVTGATISSGALKRGVQNCLEEAGADVEAFSEEFTTEAVAGEDQEAAVVVVGSGAAGLSTAIQLVEGGIENVVVCEKLGYFGGTTASSSGGAWVVGGTEFNENTGFDYTADELIQHMYEASGAEEGTLNDALIRNIADVSAEVFNEYYEDGLPWDITQYTFGDSLNEMPVAWVEAFYDYSWESGAGVTLINYLVEKAESLGVDLRLNSKVTDLLTDENDAVIGVAVEGKEEYYNLYTDKVVLATGGFQRNAELLEEIAPDYVGMVPFTGAGSTGDGIVMAEELGAYVVGDSIGGARGLDMQYGYQGELGSIVWSVGPLVNAEGVRFADETEHYSRATKEIVAQTGSTVYGIADSTNARVDVLEQAVEKGYAVKADTLEELAEALELTDVDAFVDTMNTYNSDAASGQDDSVFGVSNEAMAPATEAPFYAVKIKAVSSFSLAGLAVDENCKIVKEDGTPIENLYGAGELICGNLTAGYYTGSGTQVGSGLYEGKIIANDILSEMQ